MVYGLAGAPRWQGTADYTITQGCLGGVAQCNKGNIVSTTVSTGGVSRTQNYTYDRVSRFKTATEPGGWSQTYVYDSHGNRALLMGSYTQTDQAPLVTADDPVQAAAKYVGNRFVPAIAGHDAAGNVKAVSDTHTSYPRTPGGLGTVPTQALDLTATVANNS